MYSRDNESMSIVAESFINKIKAIIYKKSTANNSKSYLAYLGKLVDQCKNTYHHSINKKPITTDYFALTEKIETNLKAPRFKVSVRVRVTKYKNIFSKGYTENWSRGIFFY